MTTQKKIQQASYLLMASILLSRVVGLFREWALAHTVGADALTDVYYASFTIPDFINHLMAIGALSISFIPILSQYVETGQTEHANKLYRFLTTYLGIALGLCVLVGLFFASTLAHWIAPGFSRDQLDLLTLLIRIILPAQLFFLWGGLSIGLQHTHGNFLYPALAPIVYNLGIILFGVLLHKEMGVTGFSIGVTVGCIVSHGFLQWAGVKKLGYSLQPYFRFEKEILKDVRHYFFLTIPIMLGFSLVVADEWIVKYFGSYLEKGAVSWLSYARTEMRIPIGVIGGAIGMASYPFLARLWAQKNYQQYTEVLLNQIEKLWAITPIAAILLYDHALPITHAIYGGGKFTQTDYINTSQALQMFGLGIFFWTAQVLLARGFYACHKTWIPSLMGTFICFLSLPIYKLLALKYGYKGLALAGSIGVTVYSIWLAISLKHHLKKFYPELNLKDFYRFCGAWVIVIFLNKGISGVILSFGIYQNSQLTAVMDVLIATIILFGLSWLALRTVIKKFTRGEALF